MTRRWILILGGVVLLVALPVYMIMIAGSLQKTAQPEKQLEKISSTEQGILDRVEEIRARADVRELFRNRRPPEHRKANREARIAAMKAYATQKGTVLLVLKKMTDENEPRIWYVAIDDGAAFVVYDQSRSRFGKPFVYEYHVEQMELRTESILDPVEVPKKYSYKNGPTPPKNYRLWLFCRTLPRADRLGTEPGKDRKF